MCTQIRRQHAPRSGPSSTIGCRQGVMRTRAPEYDDVTHTRRAVHRTCSETFSFRSSYQFMSYPGTWYRGPSLSRCKSMHKRVILHEFRITYHCLTVHCPSYCHLSSVICHLSSVICQSQMSVSMYAICNGCRCHVTYVLRVTCYVFRFASFYSHNLTH